MAKLRKSVSGFEKWRASHSAALRAPQIFPMKGDGPITRNWWANGAGVWGLMFPRRREKLVEARYLDWIDARDVDKMAAD